MVVVGSDSQEKEADNCKQLCQDKMGEISTNAQCKVDLSTGLFIKLEVLGTSPQLFS